MSNMPWFRCWNDALSDLKIAAIAEELNKEYHEVLGIWIMILCLASQSPDRGKLLVTFQKRFTQRGIAQAMKLSEEETKVWLSKFLEMEMLVKNNGNFEVKNWSKRQPKSDNSTERVKQWRMKQDGNVSETFPFNSTSTSDSINVFKKYEREIGTLTPRISDELSEAEKEYSQEWIEAAIDEAARNNKRSWSYAHAILKRWKAEGFQSKRSKNGRNEAEPAPETYASEVYG